jgi:hypothetical protein
VVEPSCGAVVELGGGAQTERRGPRDVGDNIEDVWDGRRAPRHSGEFQSDTIMVEPWKAAVARSWWSAVAALQTWQAGADSIRGVWTSKYECWTIGCRGPPMGASAGLGSCVRADGHPTESISDLNIVYI